MTLFLTRSWRLWAALAVPAAGCGAAPAGPESFVVWGHPAEDHVAIYRIPQLAVLRSGLVLALAEARYSPRDGSKADIVIRKSRDDGRTWSESQFLEHGGPSDNHVLPGLLQDHETGRVFYFSALRRGGGTHAPATESYFRYSDDEGATWSAPVDVGAALAAADDRMRQQLLDGTAPREYAGDSPEGFGRRHFYFGPGRAIQLSSPHSAHRGRLIVPIFLIKDQTLQPRSRRGYGDSVLYSDDHGRTWNAARPAPLGEMNSSEVSVVELSDGRLLLNARGAPDRTAPGLAHAGRTLSFSTDDGATWSRPVPDDSGLPRYEETHSGLLRVPAPDSPLGSVILFSFPAGPKRTHGTVYLSLDDHRSWVFRKLVVPGSFGYSNLDRLADGSIGLLHEDANGSHVRLVRFTLEWMRQ